MKRDFKMKKVFAVLLAAFVAVLMMALPMQASAQSGDPATDPTASQYRNPGDVGGQDRPDVGGQERDSDRQEVAMVSTPPASGTGGTGGSSLPFTGFDVGVVALVALLLGATGLTLRRLSAVK